MFIRKIRKDFFMIAVTERPVDKIYFSSIVDGKKRTHTIHPNVFVNKNPDIIFQVSENKFRAFKDDGDEFVVFFK